MVESMAKALAPQSWFGAEIDREPGTYSTPGINPSATFGTLGFDVPGLWSGQTHLSGGFNSSPTTSLPGINGFAIASNGPMAYDPWNDPDVLGTPGGWVNPDGWTNPDGRGGGYSVSGFGGPAGSGPNYGGHDDGGEDSGGSDGDDPGGGEDWASGGYVSRDDLRFGNPAGPDEGHIPIQAGEFVLPRKSVKALGPERLKMLQALSA